MITDLHTHSTSSDGQYTPEELVGLAAKRGIQVLSLTDHDTTSGVCRAQAEGERLGVRVIPGIELSAREYHIFHILGYNYDPAEPTFAALCQWLQKGRDERVDRILDFLRKRGVEVTRQEAEAFSGGTILGRPHFARAMVQRGYVPDIRAAFNLHLDTEEFYQEVERKKPPVRECVETIKAAGGVVSMAHPYQIGVDDTELEEWVRRLKDWGLDAIECYYPLYTPEQQAFYLSLAKKYSLRVTGGSDFHGERVKPNIQLAALDLDVDWLLA